VPSSATTVEPVTLIRDVVAVRASRPIRFRRLAEPVVRPHVRLAISALVLVPVDINRDRHAGTT